MTAQHSFPGQLSYFGALLLAFGSLILNPASRVCVGAEPISIEQAGDHFVSFVLAEIEATRKALPAITRAAELAADRIVDRNGELLSAGDQSFALEPVWRAGGIAFSRQYTPGNTNAGFPKIESPEGKVPYYRTEQFVEHFTVKEATSADVVLLGFENEKQEQLHRSRYVKQLLSDKALIVFFGSVSSGAQIVEEFGHRDNLLLITHDVPDGGVVSISGWPQKVCSGRSIANRLYLWTFEVILAFQTDTTRICTLKLNNDWSQLRFPHLGVNGIHHLVSHSDSAEWLKVNQFFLEQVAYIAKRLDAIQRSARWLPRIPSCAGTGWWCPRSIARDWQERPGCGRSPNGGSPGPGAAPTAAPLEARTPPTNGSGAKRNMKWCIMPILTC